MKENGVASDNVITDSGPLNCLDDNLYYTKRSLMRNLYIAQKHTNV